MSTHAESKRCPFTGQQYSVNAMKGVDQTTLRPQRTPTATYYGDYLRLPELLNLQFPKSLELSGNLAHDEVMFIVVHQAHELWFKLALHEIGSVIDMFQEPAMKEDALHKGVQRLTRVKEIQHILLAQLKVLDTLTPLDFLEFRDFLFPASGFQSVQFRLFENKLGLQNKQRLHYAGASYCSALNEEDTKIVEEAEKGPTLFSSVEKWLERCPFLESDGYSFWETYQSSISKRFETERQTVRDSVYLTEAGKDVRLKEIDAEQKSFEPIFDEKQYQELRDTGKRRLSHKATKAALMIALYREHSAFILPWQLMTCLIDIDGLMTAWRYAHAAMVQRMLGLKIGTGGSSGYDYLKATASYHQIFKDFASLSTFLIPRESLPPLPEEMRLDMSFQFEVEKERSLSRSFSQEYKTPEETAAARIRTGVLEADLQPSVTDTEPSRRRSNVVDNVDPSEAGWPLKPGL